MSISPSAAYPPIRRVQDHSLLHVREVSNDRVIETSPPLTRELTTTSLSNREAQWIEGDGNEAESENLHDLPDTRTLSTTPTLNRSDSESSINSLDSTSSTRSTSVVPRHRSNCLSLMARRVRRIAIPATALLAATTIPQGESTFLTYYICITLCMGGTAGAATPACVAACLPTLGMPGP